MGSTVSTWAKSAWNVAKTVVVFAKDIVLNTLDGIPIVGHIKGAIHYTFGDKEGGDAAMKSASRSAGVMVGAVGGFVIGGPVGAVLGAVGGGVVLDVVTTGVDSAIRNKFRPSGLLEDGKQIALNPTSPWPYIVMAVRICSDMLVGRSAGSLLTASGKSSCMSQRMNRVKDVAKKVAGGKGLKKVQPECRPDAKKAIPTALVAMTATKNMKLPKCDGSQKEGNAQINPEKKSQ